VLEDAAQVYNFSCHQDKDNWLNLEIVLASPCDLLNEGRHMRRYKDELRNYEGELLTVEDGRPERVLALDAVAEGLPLVDQECKHQHNKDQA